MVRVRRKRYPAAFKAEAVRLVQTSDQRVTEIAEHLGVTAKTLHERLTADERSELEHLRRDNARVRMERDILKQAAAGSRRRCNAGRQSISGSVIAQGFARPHVQTARDGIELSVGMTRGWRARPGPDRIRRQRPLRPSV